MDKVRTTNTVLAQNIPSKQNRHSQKEIKLPKNEYTKLTVFQTTNTEIEKQLRTDTSVVTPDNPSSQYPLPVLSGINLYQFQLVQ